MDHPDRTALCDGILQRLEHKLEGLRKSLAFVQDLSNKVEQAASAGATQLAHPADDRLAGLLVRMDLEGRVFLRKSL